MAEGEEEGLELLEMAKVVALGEDGEHVLVQVGTAGPVMLVHLLGTPHPNLPNHTTYIQPCYTITRSVKLLSNLRVKTPSSLEVVLLVLSIVLGERKVLKYVQVINCLFLFKKRNLLN